MALSPQLSPQPALRSLLLCLSCRAAFEHYVRVTAAERRRAERLMGGGSLGRSFCRSYAGSLAGSLAGAAAALPQGGGLSGSGTLPHGASLAAAAAASLDSPLLRAASPAPGNTRGPQHGGKGPPQDPDPDPLDAKDRRRASLRVRRRLHNLLSWA